MVDRNELSYVAQEARQYDHDRWMVALFAPAHLRENLYSLLAFNSEISRIRETVSEPMIGDIRLQWWREALESLEQGTPKSHPVMDALACVQKQTSWAFKVMQDMIDARSTDLDAAPIHDDAGLLVYAGGTGGLLQQLLASVIHPEFNETDKDAAFRAGRSFALVGVLRAIPFHARNDLLLLPHSRLANEGLTTETVFQAENRNSFLKIVEELANLAQEDLRTAREVARQASPMIKSVQLLNSLTALYLKRLKASKFDPSHPKLTVGSQRKVLALVLGNLGIG
ncbi:MAG: squalene/phytoene synthase family protein [Sneathiella sp.]|nr:squalene/phytoene synthase family protein [Sneathiella sp.]